MSIIKWHILENWIMWHRLYVVIRRQCVILHDQLSFVKIIVTCSFSVTIHYRVRDLAFLSKRNSYDVMTILYIARFSGRTCSYSNTANLPNVNSRKIVLGVQTINMRASALYGIKCVLRIF